MSYTRTPKPESVAGKLIAFFTANPDEELTYSDAVQKFGGNRHNIAGAVARLAVLESLTVIRLKTKGRA